jgi:hypothetical protein
MFDHSKGPSWIFWVCPIKNASLRCFALWWGIVGRKQCFWSRWIDVGGLDSLHVHTLPLIWKEHGSHDIWLLTVKTKLCYYVLHVKDRKGMPLYEFQHKAMALPVWRYLPNTSRSLIETFWFFLFYVVLLCCLNMSEPWNRADENQQTQSNLFLRHLEQWRKALILERNKPGSLPGLNFANTNNIVQTLCFPWRPDFPFRCGICSHLAFDDPSKQNLPKNAEWTSIKCAVVICSSPHIHKVSQSNLRTNHLNISMLQYVSILSPSFASCQPAPNVTVRKFKIIQAHTFFTQPIGASLENRSYWSNVP